MLTARQIAKKLNDHHMRTSAGFYLSTGARAFGARVRKGIVEVLIDFDSWTRFDAATTQVRDHNGRAISLNK